MSVFWRTQVIDSSAKPNKPWLQYAFNQNSFFKHGSRAHPQAPITIERAIKRHGLQCFAVAHGVDDFVAQAFVMVVLALAGWGERGECFISHGTIVGYAPKSPA